ncbi:IS982 family transposase [Proteiniborus sp. MB09-C3]|uniref:IS982 family transposase n=1 Tax=Proteiniborus sp. MB09-C3 TaxID=3050072 RepID=UPI002552A28B|nr:IS982 family transposase [Proteiniborus sp. MB09-C3]WIV13647.1 IS982 family transposase [Proteiniborus sp. MB09-C3]
MPELYKYSIKEIENLKDFFLVTYVIIDDIYQEITPEYIKFRKNVEYSILSDSEIITISIVGELLSIDSEKAWFNFCKKNLADLFPRLCDRTRFNRTRRNLHSIIDEIRKKLSSKLGYTDDPHRIIDSIPIPVCKFGRAVFHKAFRGIATYGKCPSKKETYLGFKAHMLSTLDGYITDFVLTDASKDDRSAVWDLASSYNSLTIIGDKGYIGEKLALELKQEKEIDLISMKRNKSKIQFPKFFRQLIFKARRRVETSFSQLTEQLNINKVKAKSLWGLITRLRTKILGHNICYFINKCLNKDINLANIKELVFG